MCHHRIDVAEQFEDHEETEEDQEEAADDEPDVEFELDRDYDERDVKTPGDD